MNRLGITAVALFASWSSLAHDFTDALFCQQMQDLAEKINQGIGAQLDEITIQSGMAVQCNAKVVNFKKAVKKPFSDLQNLEWGKRLNDIYCTNDTLGQAIASGWRIKTVITDSASERLEITAACPYPMSR